MNYWRLAEPPLPPPPAGPGPAAGARAPRSLAAAVTLGGEKMAGGERSGARAGRGGPLAPNFGSKWWL